MNREWTALKKLMFLKAAQGGSGNWETLTGNPVTFETQAETTLKSCVLSFSPVQAGSGDPSPDNIRDISGYTGVTVARCKKNIYNGTLVTGKYYDANGVEQSLSSMNHSGFIPVDPNTKYTFSSVSSVRDSVMRVSGFDANKAWIAAVTQVSTPANGTPYDVTFTTPANCEYIIFNVYTGNSNVQVESGASKTTYEAYSGQDYTFSWQTEAGTVYGGTLDITTGVLTVTNGYIASYNGETLPGKWISDRDVYQAGGTPTTGAEVVYTLSTPLTYQLTAKTVQSVAGINNILTDANGTITIKYKA